MDIPDYGHALRSLHDLAPTSAADTIAALARRAGAVDVALYLADFEQETLTPIPGRGAHVDLPVTEPVQGSTPGRVFRTRQLQAEGVDEGTRVWVPIIEASECTGVLALTLPGALDAVTRSRCEELGMLAGCAISLSARYTDLYNLVRRRKAMSLPASMQWDLLPPLRLETPAVTSVGVLEPAYDVGGDCFDHSVNGGDFDLVVMDAMGHGLDSAVTSTLALGTYRHDRREGQTLDTIHERLDETLASRFGGEMFVTGQAARLELRTGDLSWTCAGHPGPLLIRGGRVVRSLECPTSLPWGLGGTMAGRGHEVLEPDDAVLFYTDGVTEGRSPDGELFGLDRFIALVEEAVADGEASESVVRRLIHEVLAYQDNRLRDDATLVWVHWKGPLAA